MAYLPGSARRVFKEMAEQSPPGSTDEALFSGLAKLASDVSDIEKEIKDLRRDVRNLD